MIDPEIKAMFEARTAARKALPEGERPTFLDSLSDACSAFRTFAEFERAMRGGYCPTIYQDSRRKRLLTRVIRAKGFRVHIGGGFAK